MQGRVDLNLRLAAVRHDLPVLCVPSAEDALHYALLLRPRLVITQVAGSDMEGLKLIESLAQATQPVPVIAVASSHDEAIEKAIWSAGATAYLPAAESRLLDETLETMLS